jgi:putative endonuclease
LRLPLRRATLRGMSRPPKPRALADRRAAEAAGRRGERIAGWWLRLKGWRILDRRVRTPAGEVDLVAKRGALIAFVEVKTRRTSGELDLAIDQRRLARVAAAAEYLMARYATAGEDIRVDVLLVAPGQVPRHLENAWIGY